VAIILSNYKMAGYVHGQFSQSSHVTFLELLTKEASAEEWNDQLNLNIWGEKSWKES